MTAQPTYDAAITVPTIDEVAADLLARFPSTLLAGWSDDAPQRQLVDAEAQALQFEMLQRALVARAASPVLLRGLAAWLRTQGYSAADAAALASAWVDLALQWYGRDFARIPATRATWAVPLVATAPQTIDANSVLVLQANDGTYFLSAQMGSSVVLNSGNSYKGTVTFAARAPGSGGNVVTGTITHVIQGPAGLQVDLSGTQVLVAPGRDEETDDAALDRALARWDTLGVGWTSRALDFLIPFYADTVTRWFVDDSNPDGAGSLRIALANAAGAATVGELAAVQAGLTGIAGRPMGSGRITAVAAATYVLSLAVTITGDGTNAGLSADVAAALAAFANTFPLGPVFLGNNTLAAVIESVRGAVAGTATFTGTIGGGATTPASTVLSISAMVAVL